MRDHGGMKHHTLLVEGKRDAIPPLANAESAGEGKGAGYYVIMGKATMRLAAGIGAEDGPFWVLGHRSKAPISAAEPVKFAVNWCALPSGHTNASPQPLHPSRKALRGLQWQGPGDEKGPRKVWPKTAGIDRA